jgi:hypothetical protein
MAILFPTLMGKRKTIPYSSDDSGSVCAQERESNNCGILSSLNVQSLQTLGKGKRKSLTFIMRFNMVDEVRRLQVSTRRKSEDLRYSCSFFNSFSIEVAEKQQLFSYCSLA